MGDETKGMNRERFFGFGLLFFLLVFVLIISGLFYFSFFTGEGNIEGLVVLKFENNTNQSGSQADNGSFFVGDNGTYVVNVTNLSKTENLNSNKSG